MEVKPGLRKSEIQERALELLRKRPQTSKYMAGEIGVSVAVLLRALRELRDQGIVECRRTKRGVLWFLKTKENLEKL